MPKKDLSGGFTKAAQRQKFVRHRDVKMKQSELEREARTQKLMCEGICTRCREKVQWRFRYDKYKPLKNVATCQSCKQKCLTKAYRAFCDGCAKKRNVCSSCCRDLDELRREEEEKGRVIESEGGQQEEGSQGVVQKEVEVEDMEGAEVGENILYSEDDEDTASSSDLKPAADSCGENPWPVAATDENDDFLKLAAMKYSKKRVVGSAEDQELASKFAAYTS